MLGTITISVDSLVMWLMVILVAIALITLLARRDKRRAHADLQCIHEAKIAHRERERHQTRSTELNYGRMIFNWLIHELGQYERFGIRLVKIEPKDSSLEVFQIHIGKEDDSVLVYGGPGYAGHPLILIEFDFVEKFGKDCEAHIFYGAIGPENYFPIPDHIRGSGSKERLFYKPVIEEIEREVERIKQSQARAIAATQ